MTKVETELTKLKAKCLNKDGSPKKGATGPELARLKQLQDAEPLTKEELEEAEKRQEQQHEKDKKDYKQRMAAKARTEQDGWHEQQPDPALNVPPPSAEHPRITTLKQALLPFTQLEVHESRPDEFILINRGTAITAGDVRAARRAMKI